MVDIDTLQLAREVKSSGFTDWREVVEYMQSGDNDFEVENQRLIHKDAIDDIMQEELANDTYMLGCFNAWFIADILDISTDAVEKMQKAEAFEGLGEMMLKHIEEVQETYARMDGYGHHFSHYDGNERELDEYYVFRVN